ncbi:protein FAM204A isoform X2 [Seriola lalandi dorsalis]|uniref:protein FAM204A isoform X2 n=1 Tax=Seriola lalandi dorsalis TaxID=1841481 RepID=UPI000C6F8404|nr:protein FAM204A isoform X2 [Seriola lalandi dorsalis]XP_056252220.1 protein FAM204A isoform X2 [Seriola aureovittata]
MYSGLLPKGLTEDDLSPGDEEDEPEDDVEEKRTEDEKFESTAGVKLSSVVEAHSTHTAGDADNDSPTCSMPGISQEMWQKFQDLRKKNEEMKTMKIPRRRKRRRHKTAGTESEEPTETRKCQEERENHWDELKQYFGVNDRFDPPACSKPPPKSGLEKSIERAVAEGDIAKAEEMSDRLATREVAVKIAQAADCRDFVQRKQEEEALRAEQKRKKQIVWGFEAKKRWETKSNMGFM